MKLKTKKSGAAETQKQPSRLREGIMKAAAAAGRFRKKHKALFVIIICALALGVTAAVIFGIRASRMPTINADSISYTRTTTLERGSLAETVTATGSVQSANTSTVTSSLSYKVKEINVQVGDYVEAGDLIVTLDSTELEEQISKAEESLADTIERAYESYLEAVEAYEKARLSEQDAYNSLSSATSAYNTASANYTRAVNEVKPEQAEYDRAAADRVSLEAALATASTQLTNAMNACVNRHVVSEAPDFGNCAHCSSASLYGTFITAQTNLQTHINDTLNTALNALNNAKTIANYTAYETAYNSALQAYNSAKTAYENASETTATRKKSMESAYETYTDSQSSDSLDDLREQLDDCSLVASTSGTVTSLNASVGSAPGNSAVATIQDTEDLIVSISVAEYDVPNIEIGMDCIITSDATEGEISGEVSMISPVADSSSGMGGGSATSSTFAAEVSVLGGSNGLLIGMNASVEIILSTIDNVFVVPYDAVGTLENGSSVVYVLTGEENGEQVFEPYEVTTGESNDYYIEIASAALAEGMVVRASAVAEEAEAEIEANSSSFSFIMGGAGQAGGGGAAPTGGGGNGQGGGMPGGG
ncbi:MAG: HlyD family efflux transporter periplasmic adaptor subunit [Oscillospiraceae bacterium]|nr:HlyD family efflux transporter periplasmic adaptor subunit [Oscillospiraceae bacterium]